MEQPKMRERRSFPPEPTEREEYWRGVIAQIGRSGTTAAEYCRSKEIEASGVAWWKRELVRREAARRAVAAAAQAAAVCEPKTSGPPDGDAAQTGSEPKTSGSIRVRRRRRRARSERRLIPVKVREPAAGVAGLHVVLAKQRTIRVEGCFDPEVLAKLVLLLEGLPC
jgi:hypothetical protein